MVYKIVNGLVAIPIGQYIKLQRNGVHLQNIAAKPKYYEYSFFPLQSLIGIVFPETFFRPNRWQSLKLGLPP